MDSGRRSGRRSLWPRGPSGKRAELLGSVEQNCASRRPARFSAGSRLAQTVAFLSLRRGGSCERAPLRPRQWDGCGRLESALESCFGGRPYPSSHPAFPGPRGISGSPEGRAALAWTERESSAVWTSLPARGPPGEGVAGRGSRRPLQEGPQAAVPTGRFPLSPRTPRFSAVASLTGAVTVVKFGAGGRDEILF